MKPPDTWSSAKQLRRAFKPYGLNLGELVFIWNKLHQNLSVLFELVVKSPSRKMGVSIWHSTDNDYAQRRMLRAAAQVATQLTPAHREDILWVLDRIDDTLRHNRNDAIHAPLTFIQGLSEAAKISVIPDPGSDSPRAKSLWKKGFNDLNEYLEENIALASILSDFAGDMFDAILNPSGRTWPDRPDLPQAHRKKSRKRSSRPNAAK